jgi:hypothetical protein
MKSSQSNIHDSFFFLIFQNIFFFKFDSRGIHKFDHSKLISSLDHFISTMPVETRRMEHVLATIVDNNKALFNDSAIAHIEHSLGGCEFALIGVSSHMKTMDLEWLILHCGGTLAKVVSDTTDFVIKGSRVGGVVAHEDKNLSVEDLDIYRHAVEKGVTMLTTLEFFQLVSILKNQFCVNLSNTLHNKTLPKFVEFLLAWHCESQSLHSEFGGRVA